MTSLKSLLAQSPSATRPPDGIRKDVLFCPSCGHESPVEGDWLVTGDGQRLRCPECRHVLGGN